MGKGWYEADTQLEAPTASICSLTFIARNRLAERGITEVMKGLVLFAVELACQSQGESRKESIWSRGHLLSSLVVRYPCWQAVDGWNICK